MDIRHDWTRAEVRAIHDLPITELVFRAQTLHRAHQKPNAVQLCTLLSIKTGACPEDCAYCPQSAHHPTEVEPERMLRVDEVLAEARRARDAGSTRFCMGAAWRDARSGPAFESVLEMVRGIRALGLEACATLGMLDDAQAAPARRGRAHLLQPQPRHLGRLLLRDHLDPHVHRAPRDPRPSSESGHQFVLRGDHRDGRVDRRPLRDAPDAREPRHSPGECPDQRPGRGRRHPARGSSPRVRALELIRMCATARILMPRAVVRLSAGRSTFERRSAAALLRRRGELDLLRRPATHHRQPGGRPRPRAPRRGGD